MTDAKTNKPLENEEHDFSHWQLPDVTESQADAPSNLFGHLGANNPPPQADDKPLLPPTMAEIEQIRAEAEQEGFEQGKVDGYNQGLEQGKLAGLEQGHSEGFSQGEQQGYEEGLNKAHEMLERLTGIVQQFEQPLMILDAEIESEMLTLAINLAKSIVGHELKTHPEHILSVLRQGVDSLPIKEQQVKLRLHPDDATLVTKMYSDAQLEKNHWEIDADPSLNSGDCIINSLRSSVDLRVEERMKQVLSQLQEQAQGIQHNVQTVKSDSNVYQTDIVDELPARDLDSMTTSSPVRHEPETTIADVNEPDAALSPNQQSPEIANLAASDAPVEEASQAPDTSVTAEDIDDAKPSTSATE